MVRYVRRFSIIILFFIIFYIPPFAYAAQYYVSTSGNDSNAGSISAPWKTFQKAGNSVAAGDTVYFRGGTYVEKVYLSKSGTSSAPITYSSYPGEVAIIDGTNTLPGNQYSSLVTLSGNYTQFQNFEVKNSNGRGVQINGTYSTVSRSNVHHIFDSGIYIYGAHNIVENNKIWRAIESNYNRDHGDWSVALSWGAAQSPNASLDTTVRNNEVYENSGEGIGCMYTENSRIEGNTVYDNWAMNIYLDTCSNVLIQRNLVYYTGNKKFWRYSTAPQGGIVLANEGIQSYPIGHNRTILNNILVANGTNIGFWIGKASGASLVNDLIANNTLINPYEESIGIDDAPHTGTQIVNNLLYQTTGGASAIRGGGISLSHNLWYPISGISGTADVRADPKLVNPNAPVVAGAVNPASYAISGGSPAINAGASVASVTSDYFGVTRNAPLDIGAVEFSSTNTSPTTSTKRSDANKDGFVNLVDLTQYFIPNYAKHVLGTQNGDFNNDGVVDGVDYVVWLLEFGT